MSTNDASKAAPPVNELDEAAFPLAEDERNYGSRGMTLRDWFAGQALAGMGSLELPYEEAARVSYEYAEALLKERNKRV